MLYKIVKIAMITSKWLDSKNLTIIHHAALFIFWIFYLRFAFDYLKKHTSPKMNSVSRGNIPQLYFHFEIKSWSMPL